MSDTSCQGVRVTGVEPNLAMNSFARATAEAQGLQPDQLHFAAGRAERLPLQSASVDLAVCTLVRRLLASHRHQLPANTIGHFGDCARLKHASPHGMTDSLNQLQAVCHCWVIAPRGLGASYVWCLSAM